jgi:glycosyltransferase involved in cell wall biosynthesis
VISVCIPVYNYDIRPLASQLSDEACKAAIVMEIIFLDDGSDNYYRNLNRQVSDSPSIKYIEQDHTGSRSAVRNRLGREASFPWLLFLDCDSGLPTGGFAERYIDVAKEADVVCGGTMYKESPPDDRNLLLRWIYGKKREQLTAAERNLQNKFAVTANNFMIRKQVFALCPFRETIRDYGHEDSVLGYDLRRSGFRVVHTDNPVYHNGLETSSRFLGKTKTALGNLLFISNNIIPDESFTDGLPLLKWRRRMKKMGMIRIAGFLFRLSEPLLKKNLTGKNPSLFLFDLYRAGILCTLP